MEKKTNNPAITKSYAKKMETISPFELKNKLINMADESIKKIAHTMLNAGRGNRTGLLPNHAKPFFCWDNSAFANVVMRFHWKKE